MRSWNELLSGLRNPAAGSAVRCVRRFAGGPAPRRCHCLRLLGFLAVTALTAACGSKQDGARFNVREAAVTGGTLSAQLDWQPGDTLLDGLDHGIPLVFEINLAAQAPGRLGLQTDLAQQRWRRELRYFPLTRQYQLRDPDNLHSAAVAPSYAVRALAIAALADLRLPLDPAVVAAPAQSYLLRIDLERDALPGALRLPALFDADWRLSTGNYAWQAKSGTG
jgi:hypothetical protein